MFINTSLILKLNNALKLCQNGQTNGKGEEILKQLQETRCYPNLLFDYISNSNNDNNLRLLSAI